MALISKEDLLTKFETGALLFQPEVKRIIKIQPEVDAEPVVRCKDCKHFHYDKLYVIQGIPVLRHEVCVFWGGGCWTSENGFCSYAERRTDERSD